MQRKRKNFARWKWRGEGSNHGRNIVREGEQDVERERVRSEGVTRQTGKIQKLTKGKEEKRGVTIEGILLGKVSKF